MPVPPSHCHLCQNVPRWEVRGGQAEPGRVNAASERAAWGADGGPAAGEHRPAASAPCAGQKDNQEAPYT